MVRFYKCLYRASCRLKHIYVVDDDRHESYYDDFFDYCERESDFYKFEEIPYCEARYLFDENVDVIIW